MKDLGLAKQIVGILIYRRRREEKKLYVSQEHYIKKVLEKFKFGKAKAVSFPLLHSLS